MTFDAIYAKYNTTVFNYLKFKIKNQMVAEELASDVMVKVHKKLDTFNSDLSSLSTWIMNIAKHSMIDYFRKRTLSVVSLNTFFENEDGDNRMDYISPMKDSSNNPEEQMIHSELSRTMYEKFESLTERQRIIASLFFFDGLSHDEIAQELAMPLGTIKANIFAARHTMMEAVPVEFHK